MTLKRMAAMMVPALALTLSTSGGALADTVSITNGGFEQLTGGYGMLGFGNDPTTTPTLAGWSTDAGSYNFVYDTASAAAGASGNSGVVALAGIGLTDASPDGGNFIAQDPDFEQGAIFQTVSGLTVGQQYTISFSYALAQQTAASDPSTTLMDGPLTAGWQVTFGSQIMNTDNLTITTGQEAFSGWKTANLTFTAGDTSQVLSFLSTEPTNGGPPFMLLDGVSIAAVPEPSTVVLMGIGLVGFGAVGLRKRSKAKSAI
jgi:PEP-CTERM motif